MREVLADTKRCEQTLQDRGAKTLFERNPGNHFSEPALRSAKGIAGCLHNKGRAAFFGLQAPGSHKIGHIRSQMALSAAPVGTYDQSSGVHHMRDGNSHDHVHDPHQA